MGSIEMQFKDKIDEYLYKEHHILGGCCSSIESLKYSVAREVAEKLTDTFIEEATDWLEDHIYEYLKMNRTWNEPDYDPKLIEDFKKYWEGE